MTKRFRKVQGYIYDNQGEGDGLLDFTGIEDMLNAQDRHIFLLKSVIQTITAESDTGGISRKRIMEIKDYWYQKLYGDGND